MAQVGADLADPGSVLADTDVGRVIDLAEPVCLIFGLVLQPHARPAGPRGRGRGHADRAAPGSCVVDLVRPVRRRGAMAAAAATAYTAADVYNHDSGRGGRGSGGAWSSSPRRARPRRRTGAVGCA